MKLLNEMIIVEFTKDQFVNELVNNLDEAVDKKELDKIVDKYAGQLKSTPDAKNKLMRYALSVLKKNPKFGKKEIDAQLKKSTSTSPEQMAKVIANEPKQPSIAQKAGQAAQKVGSAIKTGAEKVGQAAQKISKAAKTARQKAKINKLAKQTQKELPTSSPSGEIKPLVTAPLKSKSLPSLKTLASKEQEPKPTTTTNKPYEDLPDIVSQGNEKEKEGNPFDWSQFENPQSGEQTRSPIAPANEPKPEEEQPKMAPQNPEKEEPISKTSKAGIQTYGGEKFKKDKPKKSKVKREKSLASTAVSEPSPKTATQEMPPLADLTGQPEQGKQKFKPYFKKGLGNPKSELSQKKIGDKINLGNLGTPGSKRTWGTIIKRHGPNSVEVLADNGKQYTVGSGIHGHWEIEEK